MEILLRPGYKEINLSKVTQLVSGRRWAFSNRAELQPFLLGDCSRDKGTGTLRSNVACPRSRGA